MLKKRYITFLFLLPALACLASAQPSPDLPQSLEGAWDVTIAVQGAVLCTAPAVFSREGTVIADSCSGSQLGAGYGAYVRTGERQFAGTFVGSIYNPSTGQIIGRYKVRSQGTLQPDGGLLAGLFKTESFDLSGNLLSTFSGTLTGKRIQVEPLN